MPKPETPVPAEAYEQIRARLPKKPGSRRLELADELTEALVSLIRRPMSAPTAVAILRIPPSDFEAWRRQGERDLHDKRETVASRFVEDLDAAVAENNAMLEAQAMTADDPRVALEVRARRDPRTWEKGEREPDGDDAAKRYSRMTAADLTAEIGRLLQPQNVEGLVAGMRPDVLRAVADECAKRLRGDA